MIKSHYKKASKKEKLNIKRNRLQFLDFVLGSYFYG